MTYEFISDPAVSSGVDRYLLTENKRQLTYAAVIALWQENHEFREFFINLLRDSSFNAFRWETPPVSAVNSDRLFEFVLVDSPWLIRPADQMPFNKYFRKNDHSGDIVDFLNLGRDARLIVPVPAHADTNYSHLAAFIRTGHKEQVHGLWEKTGATMARHLSAEPIWLSTAGGGVDWLHIRMDSWPKYYHHRPYKSGLSV